MANPAPGFQRDPSRKITVEPYGRAITVRFGDTVIASSERALELREGSYPPVLYLPFDDVYFEHLEKTATSTQCPFKGDASWWSVTARNEAASDVMWAYEAPYDEMLAIRDHGAFYPDKVRIEATRRQGDPRDLCAAARATVLWRRSGIRTWSTRRRQRLRKSSPILLR